MIEPKLKKKTLMDKVLRNQFFITICTVFLLVFILVGSSYALLNNRTETGLTDVVVQSGNLQATITSEGDVIEKVYNTLGVGNDIGLTYDPYTFTISNSSNNTISYYELRVVDKEYEISTLPHKALNFSISKDNGEYSSPQNLGDNRSYIYTGESLAPGESHTFNLKLWVNEEFGKYANNKVLKASIELTLYSEVPTRNYVIYDTQGGSFIPKTSVASKRVTNQVPIKKGYAFIGWSSSKEGNVEYESNAIYDRTNGTTLYAMWKDTMYSIMLKNAELDNTSSKYVESETGIDFTKISSNTNGRGLYMMADTKDNTYPIVYYRGNVDNNNVMFGGFCWKIVRTTETGGIKLIYNGSPVDTYEKTMLSKEQYSNVNNTGFTYDESSDYWKLTTSYTTGTVSFSVPDASNYIVDVLGYVNNGAGVTGTYSITSGSTSILNGTLNQYGEVTTNKEVGALTSTNTITINITGTGWQYFYVRLIQKGELIGKGCDNIGSSVYLKGAAFNRKSNSLAYNGYMYNKVYEHVDESPVENAYFANDIVFENGIYKLQNAEVGYTTSRHYTCNSTDSTGTCENIRYYITGTRYIELTSGIKIEDAVREMTSDSNINKTDSNAKVELEDWFENNLLTYADNIEDTIWCNDRSISNLGAFSTTGSSYLLYKSYNRATTKNINLKCENDVDNFSLSNPLAKLNYPIGLLTSDEVKLAGVAAIGVVNTNYYLYTKSYYWTMSPSHFNSPGSGAYGFHVTAYGVLGGSYVSNALGLRPSISLAFGTSFKTGDGTVGNPYVVE